MNRFRVMCFHVFAFRISLANIEDNNNTTNNNIVVINKDNVNNVNDHEYNGNDNEFSILLKDLNSKDSVLMEVGNSFVMITESVRSEKHNEKKHQ